LAIIIIKVVGVIISQTLFLVTPHSNVDSITTVGRGLHVCHLGQPHTGKLSVFPLSACQNKLSLVLCKNKTCMWNVCYKHKRKCNTKYIFVMLIVIIF